MEVCIYRHTPTTLLRDPLVLKMPNKIILFKP